MSGCVDGSLDKNTSAGARLVDTDEEEKGLLGEASTAGQTAVEAGDKMELTGTAA